MADIHSDGEYILRNVGGGPWTCSGSPGPTGTRRARRTGGWPRASI